MASSQAAQIAALTEAVASLTALVTEGAPAASKGKGGTPKSDPRLPTLSCWNVSNARVSVKGDTLTYTRKDGESRKYNVLSEKDAISLVKAHVKAGRLFAIPA